MSPRWFCFLRAINTGDRRVTNERLLDAFVSFGMVAPAAYQAAGNITFHTADGAVPDEDELAGHLSAALGFECPVFVRRGDVLQDITDRNPFTDAELAGTEGRVQLTFLATAPNADLEADVLGLVPDDDRVVLAGTEWWWLPRRGISTSELPVRQIETILGPMTMRTSATIDRLLTRFPPIS